MKLQQNHQSRGSCPSIIRLVKLFLQLFVVVSLLANCVHKNSRQGREANGPSRITSEGLAFPTLTLAKQGLSRIKICQESHCRIEYHDVKNVPLVGLNPGPYTIAVDDCVPAGDCRPAEDLRGIRAPYPSQASANIEQLWGQELDNLVSRVVSIQVKYTSKQALDLAPTGRLSPFQTEAQLRSEFIGGLVLHPTNKHDALKLGSPNAIAVTLVKYKPTQAWGVARLGHSALVFEKVNLDGSRSTIRFISWPKIDKFVSKEEASASKVSYISYELPSISEAQYYNFSKWIRETEFETWSGDPLNTAYTSRRQTKRLIETVLRLEPYDVDRFLKSNKALQELPGYKKAVSSGDKNTVELLDQLFADHARVDADIVELQTSLSVTQRNDLVVRQKDTLEKLRKSLGLPTTVDPERALFNVENPWEPRADAESIQKLYGGSGPIDQAKFASSRDELIVINRELFHQRHKYGSTYSALKMNCAHVTGICMNALYDTDQFYSPARILPETPGGQIERAYKKFSGESPSIVKRGTLAVASILSVAIAAVHLSDSDILRLAAQGDTPNTAHAASIEDDLEEYDHARDNFALIGKLMAFVVRPSDGLSKTD